jgi:hypothetical protein
MSSRNESTIIILLLLFFVSFITYNIAFFNLFDKINLPTVSTINNETSNIDKKEAVSHFDLNFHNFFINLKNNNDIKPDEHKNEKRLIFMLVDAMRYDFIFEVNNEDKSEIAQNRIRMPFLNKLIRQKNGIPFKLVAKPPTVTLPRLKVTC